MKCPLVLLLVLTATASFNLARAQDNGASYKVQEMAKSGPWTISKVKPKGRPFYGMMSRSYSDGKMFRYFKGNGVSSVMIYDSVALQALPKGAATVQGTFTFTKADGKDTKPMKVSISTANNLTSEQDAVITFDVSQDAYFLVGVADSEAFVLKFKGYTGKFNLRNSTEAAKEMVKVVDSKN